MNPIPQSPHVLKTGLLDRTQSICPVCKKTVDADLVLVDGRVLMTKRCEQHGRFESLVSSDAQMYQRSLAHDQPGKKPRQFATQAAKGCPDDCGICPNHQQHTCVALLEVSDNCNLSCPSCYAGSGSRPARYLDLKTANFMLDRYLDYEGRPEVLQISGGEPTLHPELFSLIKLAHAKRIRHLMLNTNGVRMVEDREFVKELADANIEVYFQFDGFEPQIYQKLRGGAAVLKLKLQALDALAKYHIPTTLVTTLARGVNEDQIGRIISFGVENRFVRGITFQPIIFVQDGLVFDPLDRLTLPDVVKAIDAQTQGLFRVSDFVPMPCPHPTCCSLTYAFIKGGRVTPVTRKVDVEKYLDYFCNRIIASPAGLLRKALEGLWSASATFNSTDVLKDFACVCGIPFSPHILQELKDNVIRIMVKPFMDAYTFDFKRAKKCCIHVLQTDGRLIPFCVYNNILRPRAHA
ncbi:MAG TPA: radical SAM protein [Candidatus Omnitrophota bacterium]|nr:radical SAM protein [Candidatus Omnitrophota bacterium]HRZ14394.1 radical SAM protein [Candidatus Omnitrophota bacterium]